MLAASSAVGRLAVAALGPRRRPARAAPTPQPSRRAHDASGAGGAARDHGARGVASTGSTRPRSERSAPRAAPTLHRLIAAAAPSTLNARTERRADRHPAQPHRHGHRPPDRRRHEAGTASPGTTTVADHRRCHEAAGHDVSSVFTRRARRRVGTAALFASEDEVHAVRALLARRGGPARSIAHDNARRWSRTARQRPARRTTAGFTFLHLSAPDNAGHAHGFMSPRLPRRRPGDRPAARARSEDDRRDPPAPGPPRSCIVTADHGGTAQGPQRPDATGQNYRIPFLVWGPAVGAPARPLRPEPRLRRPGLTRRTRYSDRPAAGPQRRRGQPGDRPARLGAVPGSELDRGAGPGLRTDLAAGGDQAQSWPSSRSSASSTVPS